MKITVESTTKIVQVNGVHARIWEGLTETGIPIQCFMTRIAVSKEYNSEQFEKELNECKAPSAEIEALPLRMAL